MAKKKLPKSVTVIPVDIYYTKVLIVWSDKDLKKIADYYDVSLGYSDNCGGSCWQVCSSSGDVVSVVAMRNRDLTTLAHELMHVVFDICDDRGVEYTKNSGNEAFTYLHSYLMDQAEKDLKKHMKKCKKSIDGD